MTTTIVVNHAISRAYPSMRAYLAGSRSALGTITNRTSPKLKASKSGIPNPNPSSSKKNPKYRVNSMNASGMTNNEGITERKDRRAHVLSAFWSGDSASLLFPANRSIAASAKLAIQKKMA